MRPLLSCRPDFNPIELVFSTPKASQRKAAKRTLLTLRRATAAALDILTPPHGINFFRHRGNQADAST